MVSLSLLNDTFSFYLGKKNIPRDFYLKTQDLTLLLMGAENLVKKDMEKVLNRFDLS